MKQVIMKGQVEPVTLSEAIISSVDSLTYWFII